MGICCLTMPGPLSRTVILNRVALVKLTFSLPSGSSSISVGSPSFCFLLGAGLAFAPPLSASMMTWISGRMPASSQASSELSTASFTVVSSALRGLSKPSKWRFLAKNSLTAISFCLVAIDSAVAGVLGCFAIGSLLASHRPAGGGRSNKNPPAPR